MASMAPSYDHQLGEAEWLQEVNRVVDDALTELNHGYPTPFDQIDLTVNNALVESDYGSPNLFGWTISNTTFENALRKKPIRWTSEEHRLFLEGLEKYGKGDWRSISRFTVVTRTPVQVASHAQKYFLSLKKSQNNHGNRNTATTANAAAPSLH